MRQTQAVIKTRPRSHKPSLNLVLILVALAGLLVAAIVALSGKSASLVLATTLVITGLPLVWLTLKQLFRGKFNVDLIAMLAIIGGFVFHQYLAGVIIVLMYAGGNMLEEYALNRAARSLQSLIKANPTHANLKRGQDLIEVEIDRIKPGDIVVVRSGEQVPVDGTIMVGSSSFDEAHLTGEPVAHNHQVGEAVLSGVINLGDTVELRATKTAAHSTFNTIVELVKKAQAQKAPINRLADTYGAWFTPFVLIFATATWFISHNWTTVYTVLVVATPCPLLIAAPVAIISGIGRASRRGIIVKEGAALEAGANVNAVVFDKTGTLTEGQPSLERIITFNGVNENTVLQRAASLEYDSAHIISRAIEAAARRANVSLLKRHKLMQQTNQGLYGKVGATVVSVGNIAYLRKRHIKLPPTAAKLLEDNANSSLLIGVAFNDKLAGILVFNDAVRAGVSTTLERLRKIGITNQHILSGDKQARVDILAHELHITDAVGELLPADKLTHIQKLSHEQNLRLAMVGDGTNDAPSLAAARLSIALGQDGSAISSQSADVVIANDAFSKVADYFVIARASITIAKQSIWFGMGLSLLAMVAAAVGLIQPVGGALLQEAIDVTVILNALRVLLIRL